MVGMVYGWEWLILLRSYRLARASYYALAALVATEDEPPPIS